MNILIEIIGWVGMLFIVVAYYLVSHKEIRGSSRVYQLMNLFGAILVGANVYYNKAWSSFVLQCAWAIIAILALAKKKKD